MPGSRSSSRELGPYELIETLGSGSSAKVYRARNKFLGTEVAMKVLHTPLLNEQAERFLEEARIVAHLQHPNIVRVLGFDVEQSVPYLVMEYAPLGSLRQRHAPGTRLPLSLVVFYVKEAASALQYAHDRGETHLDVKPENMLVGKHGEVLLSDFGIAGKIQLQHPQMRRGAVGTVPYMAPEQIRRRPGKATDQYALAIVVYEWLTGSYPFGGTNEEIALQHLYAEPPSVCASNPLVSPAVEAVILKALSKDPQQRYPSISAFAFALEAASNRDLQGNLAPRHRQARPPVTPTPIQQAKNQHTVLVISCLAVSLLFLVFLSWLTVAAIAHPVSVTITPLSMQLAQSETLLAVTGHPDPTRQQVPARYITTTSPPLSKTVNATGAGTTPGVLAQGYVTFYNGLPEPQTVPQGTEITASNGVVVVTSVAATIPAANPPSSFGMVTIPAHALHPGSSGNIAAGAINEACCAGDNSISVKNLAPFSGGQDPQAYTYVRPSDISGADAALEPALSATAQQSLQKQMRPGEASAGSMHCMSTVNANHPVNSRAASVQITVRLQCYEEVYDKAEAEQFFRLMLAQEAVRRFGASYALSGMITVQSFQAISKNDLNGSIILHATVSGSWAFQFSSAQKQRFLKLIDGKKAKNAATLLNMQQGVSTADIQASFWVPWFIRDNLPINANHATLNIAPVTR